MPQIIHDDVDRAILARLQEDGRIANVDLAEAVKLSPSACLRRVKALEAEGVIAGYRAELDQARLGLGLTVFIALKVAVHSGEEAERLEAELASIPAILACYIISGAADIHVEAVVPDLAAYERLLMGRILNIPNVIEAHSTFAIRTLKRRAPLPIADWQ